MSLAWPASSPGVAPPDEVPTEVMAFLSGSGGLYALSPGVGAYAITDLGSSGRPSISVTGDWAIATIAGTMPPLLQRLSGFGRNGWLGIVAHELGHGALHLSTRRTMEAPGSSRP